MLLWLLPVVLQLLVVVFLYLLLLFIKIKVFIKCFLISLFQGSLMANIYGQPGAEIDLLKGK